MRCKNCGWPNEDNVSRCVKCNAPLQGSMIDSARQQSLQASSNESEPLNATLREPSSSGSFANPSNDALAILNYSKMGRIYPKAQIRDQR